jgi:hypothetical protein
MMRQMLSVSFLTQLHHLVKFLSKTCVIGSDLPDNLITVQTENKLWLSTNAIMPRNFGGKIAIDFDHLQEAVFASNGVDVLISSFALRIPSGSEVDQNMRMLVPEKMRV